MSATIAKNASAVSNNAIA